MRSAPTSTTLSKMAHPTRAPQMAALVVGTMTGREGNGIGKVQQQQEQGKTLSDSKKKTRRTSIDASTSATAAANQQSTIVDVGDGHDSPEQQFAN
jgi:hypothetical protein